MRRQHVYENASSRLSLLLPQFYVLHTNGIRHQKCQYEAFFAVKEAQVKEVTPEKFPCWVYNDVQKATLLPFFQCFFRSPRRIPHELFVIVAEIPVRAVEKFVF